MKKRVMVADDNEQFLELMDAYFRRQEDMELVYKASNGLEAIEALKQHEVDVLILDIIMPGMDGLEVLEELAKEPVKPYVIMLSAIGQDDFVRRAINMGARYYMVKPINFDVLRRRILEVSGSATYVPSAVPVGTAAPAPSAAHSLEERISTIFITVGIPAHIKGYQYLREAIRMTVENPDLINRITKELYPSVARHFATTPSKVERAIRHAIEVAWSRGKIENINQVFGHEIYNSNDKPTNGEFIALVADKLSMERA
ncbi:MAG: sporulation transcription factor Spo0A [Christensenellales bacterium]|jgi:two-component system response regulator (stage 0 sporulation protein A)